MLVLLCCNEAKKNQLRQEVIFDDTLRYRGKYLVPLGLHDSMMNVIDKQEFVSVFFMLGFNNTPVSIKYANKQKKGFILTTNEILGMAKEVKIPKGDNAFYVEINREEYKFSLYRKYINIFINIDTSSKALKIEYTNSIPAFY